MDILLEHKNFCNEYKPDENRLIFDLDERVFKPIHVSVIDVNEATTYTLMFESWLKAKSQAIPEGFVLVNKSDLINTYYWDGCEYVVDHPSDYEMELEQGEIITFEKWQRTKSTNVYFANIYTDEDDFDVVQFETLEEAENAVSENKEMIESQEQSHD